MNIKDKPSMGISGRIAAAFQTNALTPLLALVALLLGRYRVRAEHAAIVKAAAAHDLGAVIALLDDHRPSSAGCTSRSRC